MGTASVHSVSYNTISGFLPQLSATGNALFNPGSGNFAAGTNLLSSGTCDPEITLANCVNAASTAVVPTPSAVWLFAGGMAEFIPFRRRRNPRQQA